MTVTLIQALAGLATALGLGTSLPLLVRNLWAHWTGKAARERDATQAAIDERDNAWQREARRQAEATAFKEYAARLRRALVEAGVDPADIPPWPQCPKEDP